MKFCRTKKKEKNILIEEDEEEEIGILMMMQNSDAEHRSDKSEVEWRSGCVKERRSGDELSPSFLNNSVWYFKTRASNHMCGDESFFNELTEIEDKLVSCRDDSKVMIKGRGIIRQMQKDERVGEIRDVYCDPDLKSNILSIG